MESGDVSDIKKRVKEHDNRDYQLIKSICKFYKITDFDFFEDSRRQPGAKARQLFIFVAIRNLQMSQSVIAKKLYVSKCYISQVMTRWDSHMKKEKFRNKFSQIINFTNFTPLHQKITHVKKRN